MLPNSDICGSNNLTENTHKSFQCNFCDHSSISFSLKSFYQIPLTWSKFYQQALKVSRSGNKFVEPLLLPKNEPNHTVILEYFNIKE